MRFLLFLQKKCPTRLKLLRFPSVMKTTQIQHFLLSTLLGKIQGGVSLASSPLLPLSLIHI